jgi:hypothetical protein
MQYRVASAVFAVVLAVVGVAVLWRSRWVQT